MAAAPRPRERKRAYLVDWKKSSPGDFFETLRGFRRQKAWFLPLAQRAQGESSVVASRLKLSGDSVSGRAVRSTPVEAICSALTRSLKPLRIVLRRWENA